MQPLQKVITPKPFKAPPPTTVRYQYIEECVLPLEEMGLPEPIIYRFLKSEHPQNGPQVWTVTMDGLEDPNVKEFFLVHAEDLVEGKITALCEWNGWKFYARRYNEFGHLSMPLIRKVYPTLLAQQLVSVQPLTAPTNLIDLIRTRHKASKLKKDEEAM
jgi:hypothetical protein